MSFNQSRSDKSDTQYRRSGRPASSNQQRSSSGAYGKGGGGPAPSPSSSPLSSNRSYKKSNNAQGGQSRVNFPAANSSDSSTASAPRNVQNGAHVQQPPLHGTLDVPVASTVAKPTETSAAQRGTRAVPKAPTSPLAAMNSDTAAPSTPAKTSGDASKAFPFQFGSISPGFMNGMQIPARTNSAPPNLDEQKRDQARHDAYKSVPSLPTPAPKQQLPSKDVSAAADQSSAGEAHPVPKGKKDAQVSPAPSVSQTHKPPVLPIPMTSMQMPFHQSQMSVQFGAPNQQIQSQGVTATSLQMPVHMPIPMGNAPQVQQPMFVQGLQPHPMQPQGIMHQGQGLSFTPQLGPQLPPQLSNLAIGISSQYPQQQGGKFGGPRKTPVKITDPKTHEELRLDKRTDAYADGGSSGMRSHPNMPPQSQPIPSFSPTHPISYYNSYNAGNIYFPPSSSLPLTSSQIAPNSQPPRYNYPVSQAPQNVSFINASALNHLPVNKPGTAVHGVAEPPNYDYTRDVHNVMSSTPLSTVQVTVKPASGSIGEKVPNQPVSKSSSAVEKVVSDKPSRSSGEATLSLSKKDLETCSESSLQQSKPGSESSATKSLPVATKESVEVSADNLATNSRRSDLTAQSEESVPVATNAEGRRRETLSRSNSINAHQKKPGQKGYVQPQPQHQIGEQSTTMSNMPVQSREPTDIGVPETVGPKSNLPASSVTNEGFTESIRESVLTTDDKVDSAGDGFSHVSSEISVVNQDAIHLSKPDENSPPEEQLERGLHEVVKEGGNSFEISSASIPLKSIDLVKKTKEESALSSTDFGNEVRSLATAQKGRDESVTCHEESVRTSDNVDVSTFRNLDFTDVRNSYGDCTMASDVSSGKSVDMGITEISLTKFSVSDLESDPVPALDLSEAAPKHEGESQESMGSGFISLGVSSLKDKPVELSRSKSTLGRTKKKRKDICQKADAAGTTADLYMAYKGPEEKKEAFVPTEVSETTSSKQAPPDAPHDDTVAKDKAVQNKAEPDDWEDAADISTPRLDASDDGGQTHGGLAQHDTDENANTAKKYSRDFLLKFSEQCTDLPQGFEMTSDIAETLMSINVSPLADRDPYPSPGRVVDRSNSGSRMDRRASGMTDDDRWSKIPGPFGTGRDLRVDIGYTTGFRPGQGGNFAVPRNPRPQTPLPYAGGILPGPMQSMGPQGGIQRNSPDSDRWQRATNFQQKGLFPSPHTPLQVMHKAEKKYEVGKVANEEDTKQRQLKAILNKLTPQNFEKLFQQVKAVNIDNAVTLTGVISQIFDKALMEPTFCEMYANFCSHLAGELPDFSEDNEKITFKRLLLNKCQEEFERGEREQEEANKADEEGEIKQTEEQREEKRVKARRRMLGNIRLIGELYKKRMLTERIMHECINKLLGQNQNPGEEDVEALCKLMSTIGEMIDHPRAKDYMDAYFERMLMLSTNMKLSSRVRFMLKDAIDLRKNKWQQRRKVEGPKKIEEVHRDAAQERQLQAGRLARNTSMNPSVRRTPMDFGTRGSTMLPSPNAQVGCFRGLPTHVHGYGTQDVRFEEKHIYEARTLSVPLPQRPLADDSITLGPQGGLARGMSFRGPPAIGSTTADISPSLGDPRRMAAGLNGFSTASERPAYSPREDLVSRYVPDRFAVPAAYDQLNAQERNVNYVNRDLRSIDRGFDRSVATSPPARAQGSAFMQNTPSEKVWPEERLREKSIAAIKEFYSARDEEEVALCIKDLNSPSYHPSMISLWITDSFERKDVERNLLAKLLVNLVRSPDGILTRAQLVKGFESVLSNLEDTVNDAPKAAEFLGRIFAKVIIETVLPLREVGRLIHEGGEEPGSLVEFGLGGDVLGSTLEFIKADKGESVLNDIIIGSDLRCDDFRPPDPRRSSRILEKFIVR